MTTGRINQIARSTPPARERRGGAGRTPGEGPEAPPRTGERQDVNELSWKGRNERPATAATPRRTGGPRTMTIQLPPLKAPRAPVRTQRIPPGNALTGAGGLRHTALRRGVRTPWTTPTNGGSHGAAPPGNLGIETGQRPTIHRLQRCRGRRGPRASVTPARGGRASPERD